MFFKILRRMKEKVIGESWYEATECGHKTKKKDVIKAFREETTTIVPLKNGKTPYCHQCLEKMAIQCAWCGKPIFIGDPITLYSPKDPENFKIPEGAVVYSEKPLCLVGCLRWDCADTGADRAGFWHPPGKVYRVLSPLEAIMNDPVKGAIFVEDLSDAKEALQLQRKVLNS